MTKPDAVFANEVRSAIENLNERLVEAYDAGLSIEIDFYRRETIGKYGVQQQFYAKRIDRCVPL